MLISHIHYPLRVALMASVCAAAYLFLGQDPTFACIGAVFGTGTDYAASKLNGGNRLVGTLLGGGIGILCYRLYLWVYPQGHFSIFLLLFLFSGLLVLALLTKWLRPGALQPASVVLCILLFGASELHYVDYAVQRMVDTSVGVVIALLVSFLLDRYSQRSM